MAFDPTSFVLDTPRPLPLILLLDKSGSMDGEKIATLNAAIQELGQDLAQAETPQGEVHIVMIVFDHGVTVQPMVPAREFLPESLTAGGATAMGAAIDAARALIEDRDRVPSRAYAPTMVLVSDGQPTDDVRGPLQRLFDSERGRKALRLALAIGNDADVDTLQKFVGNPELPVIKATEVRRIRDFFRWVSMSVQVRSKSRNPDQPTVAPLVDFGEDDIVF